MRKDEFTAAYVECALWASRDETGEPLDADYSPDDVAPDAMEKMICDCWKFQIDNAADLKVAYARYERRNGTTPAENAGYDFWLTRNGHGTGFWDRGLGDVGDRLTRASHAFGESDLYVGDDGRLYIA